MPATDAPAIILRVSPLAPDWLRAAFEHGCEEEGVPVRVAANDGPTDDLATRAAAESALGVGAGAGVDGSVAVAVLRDGFSGPVLRLTEPDRLSARLLGADAARLVKGMPLRTPRPHR